MCKHFTHCAQSLYLKILGFSAGLCQLFAVHFRAAFMHLLCPLQPFLHAQLNSFLEEALTSGKVVHTGFQLLGSVHPHNSADSKVCRVCIYPSNVLLDTQLFYCVVLRLLLSKE